MNNLFLTVFSLSAMGSIVILCVVILDKIFSANYSRRWLYIIWVVIAIRLIIPVNIRIVDIPVISNSNRLVDVNPINTVDIEKASDSNIIHKNTMNENIQSTPDISEAKDSDNTSERIIKEELPRESILSNNIVYISVIDVITVIWIIGVVFFVIYHFGAFLSYRRKIFRYSLLVDDHELLEQYHNLCKELDINRQISISACNQVQSPMLMGFVKPCIVLPAQKFTKEQYYFILKHELIHYKHRDLYYKLILLFVAALHWFNPFVHYMVYMANTDMELYCDEQLVAKKDLLYREKYSLTLLQIIIDANKKSNLLLSNGLVSKNGRLKNRFIQIMNAKPTKRGTCFIMGLICLIVVLGNLTAWLIPVKASNANMVDLQTSSSITEEEKQQYNEPEQLEKISSVLVIGMDGVNTNDNSRADSILVVSVKPDKRKIYLTSFLRDMYLEIPEHGKNKLGSAFDLGGVDLVKKTIETNFDISIDYTATVNMEAFENIINSIGGIEIELSEKEAQYLNSTNFISNKQYRNVIAGKQNLNGNQALGYLRVRKIPTLYGENGDLGRTDRLRGLLLSAIAECSTKDIGELAKLILNIIPSVSTDLDLNQIHIYLNTVLHSDLYTDTLRVPADGSYTEKVQDGMNFIDVDLDKNRMALKQLYN